MTKPERRLEAMGVQRDYLRWSIIPTAGIPGGWIAAAALHTPAYPPMELMVRCLVPFTAYVLFVAVVVWVRDRAAVDIQRLRSASETSGGAQ